MTKKLFQGEVLNYLKVLANIERYADQKLNEKVLLKIHKEISKGTLKRPEDAGRYSNIQVVVGRHEFGKVLVTFRPPIAYEVPKLTKTYFDWLNKETKELNPVLIAGITHYELVKIDPFVYGNGRTARAFAILLLYKSGFDIKRFFALDV